MRRKERIREKRFEKRVRKEWERGGESVEGCAACVGPSVFIFSLVTLVYFVFVEPLRLVLFENGESETTVPVASSVENAPYMTPEAADLERTLAAGAMGVLFLVVLIVACAFLGVKKDAAREERHQEVVWDWDVGKGEEDNYGQAAAKSKDKKKRKQRERKMKNKRRQLKQGAGPAVVGGGDGDTEEEEKEGENITVRASFLGRWWLMLTKGRRKHVGAEEEEGSEGQEEEEEEEEEEEQQQQQQLAHDDDDEEEVVAAAATITEGEEKIGGKGEDDCDEGKQLGEEEQEHDALVAAAARAQGGGKESDSENEAAGDHADDNDDDGGGDDIPIDLLCPISYQLYESPVVALDGETYSRAAIEGWIATCERKGLPLTSPQLGSTMGPYLVPNRLIQRQVVAFLEESERKRKGT